MKQIIAAFMMAIAAATIAVAQPHDHKTTATAAEVVNKGEVKRINTETGKITISHGPLKAFDMPAMTMAFSAKDPAMLKKVKTGDKVDFVLEKSGENLVITRIDVVR